ncbi:hypothetical protein HIM_04084 [Hirsutella minnesotensis 3608]|uniref:Uncharacterized protein n=1 Tax=Hirsutella minnesotensis 3608 TaxID=1043627 RepID=A0A0F7ZPZ4_9HYPO|nr:hypothetical protein HIM_08313 [Hirsutella minnesotensis 3608]KJZ76355.1 hypothetical protein HIM_04084 [Hirsutella minnesotensis 3608]
MSPVPTHRGAQDGVVSIVCIRCREEKPAEDFLTRRKSVGHTRSCLSCRNQRASHVGFYPSLREVFNADQLKYSRSRSATQTLRDVAIRPPSPQRPASKRTDPVVRLSPAQNRSGTRPASSETLLGRHTARSFEESINQPRVVLGTPIPPSQGSARSFRTLAPTPLMQLTTEQAAPHSGLSAMRSSTSGIDYSYVAARFHKGGKNSQDDPSKARARTKLATIQRDHRSRRRADARPDRLRTGGFQGGGMIPKEGDDRGQFSESDIDAEDYVNVLLSPARPRRYLEQLGIEPDSEPGEEDEDGDRNNDSVDRSPLRRWPPRPSARPRRGRRGPAPGTGGRPRRSRRETRSSRPPRRLRSPVIIPPEELAVFHAQDPVWNGDLDACALTDRDKATLREFWTKLDNDQMEYCSRCRECWFQMEIDL